MVHIARLTEYRAGPDFRVTVVLKVEGLLCPQKTLAQEVGATLHRLPTNHVLPFYDTNLVAAASPAQSCVPL